MQRRKFLLGAGSLAAAGAAAMGTGAFTSVEANRGLAVKASNDAGALLGLKKIEDSANSDEYVEVMGSGGTGDPKTISIDISSDSDGTGLNDNATTKIKRLFRVTNQGSQNVYVWASGLPTDPRVAFASGETSQIQNAGTGAGENQGAFSINSNLDENDIDDSTGTGGEEAAPLLAPGDYVDVELFAFGSLDGLDFDSDITINAVAEDQVDS
jgi:hypothetical protein